MTKTLGSLGLALALAFGLAGTAAAQSRTIHDPVDKTIPGYSDIRGLTVHNNAHFVRATIRLRSVVPDKTSAYLLINAKKGRKGVPVQFSVGTESSGHGHHKILVSVGEEDSSSTVTCHRLRVRVQPRQHRVRISVPQHCLGGLPRVRPTTFAALTEEPGDGSDENMTRTIRLHRGSPLLRPQKNAFSGR